MDDAAAWLDVALADDAEAPYAPQHNNQPVGVRGCTLSILIWFGAWAGMMRRRTVTAPTATGAGGQR